MNQSTLTYKVVEEREQQRNGTRPTLNYNVNQHFPPRDKRFLIANSTFKNLLIHLILRPWNTSPSTKILNKGYYNDKGKQIYSKKAISQLVHSQEHL